MGKHGSAKKACICCGSLRVLPVDLEAGNGLGVGGVRVTAKIPVDTRRHKLRTSTVLAEVCVDCGVVSLRATHFERLRDAWEQGVKALPLAEAGRAKG
jgi:hypothetical protein